MYPLYVSIIGFVVLLVSDDWHFAAIGAALIIGGSVAWAISGRRGISINIEATKVGADPWRSE